MKKLSILVILLALLLTACTAPMVTDVTMEEDDASAGEAAATEEPAEESAADEAEASTEDATEDTASRPSRLTGAAPASTSPPDPSQVDLGRRLSDRSLKRSTRFAPIPQHWHEPEYDETESGTIRQQLFADAA